MATPVKTSLHEAAKPGGGEDARSGPALPLPGKKNKKSNAALAALAGNQLKTPEDLSAYLNLGRDQLFAMSEQLDALAAEFHATYVMMRKRLLRAASRSSNAREKWAYRMVVRKAMKPFKAAAKAAASASDQSSRSARLLRRFWKTYMEITESIVPKRRGER